MANRAMPSQGPPAVMSFQNSRSLSTRAVGGFPAISAAFTAPIEIPATQVGACSDPASAS
jgi:hypothetical protein